YASLQPAYRIGIAPLEPLAPTAPGLYANSKTQRPPAPKPVPASLASRVKTPSGPAAIPASRQKQSVRFPHAADFSWIEGVIELSELGQWQLRYAEPKGDDPWHGCVLLESNSRLGGLHAGSIGRVEGESIYEPRDRGPVPN